jgi:hypothetical protein
MRRGYSLLNRSIPIRAASGHCEAFEGELARGTREAWSKVPISAVESPAGF